MPDLPPVDLSAAERQWNVERPWRIGMTGFDTLHLLDSPTFATFDDAVREVSRRDPLGHKGEIVVQVRAFSGIPRLASGGSARCQTIDVGGGTTVYVVPDSLVKVQQPAPSEGRGAETGPGWQNDSMAYYRRCCDEGTIGIGIQRDLLAECDYQREQRGAMETRFLALRAALTAAEAERDEAVTLAGKAVNAYAAVKVFDGKYDSTVSDFRARLAKLTKEGT